MGSRRRRTSFILRTHQHHQHSSVCSAAPFRAPAGLKRRRMDRQREAPTAKAFRIPFPHQPSGSLLALGQVSAVGLRSWYSWGRTSGRFMGGLCTCWLQSGRQSVRVRRPMPGSSPVRTPRTAMVGPGPVGAWHGRRRADRACRGGRRWARCHGHGALQATTVIRTMTWADSRRFVQSLRFRYRPEPAENGPRCHG